MIAQEFGPYPPLPCTIRKYIPTTKPVKIPHIRKLHNRVAPQLSLKIAKALEIVPPIEGGILSLAKMFASSFWLAVCGVWVFKTTGAGVV